MINRLRRIWRTMLLGGTLAALVPASHALAATGVADAGSGPATSTITGTDPEPIIPAIVVVLQAFLQIA